MEIRFQFVIILLHVFSSSTCFCTGQSINQPRPVSVKTPVGEIIGKVETVTFDGKHYNVTEFLGIPYAEPPVGEKRFRKPVPKSPFVLPYIAYDYGATCIQPRSISLTQKVKLAEDCLFLNIFVPGNSINSTRKLPVMVWIHGGGFVHGSATVYPGDNLSAFGNVIVVAMNYRLAIMGFLRTKESSANFGLWDQHLAIKWVNDNIASFGGDTNNITIFGESAGSSSVVYQILFPGNKNLFQRAIAESGGVTSQWAFSPVELSEAVFKNFTTDVGCNVGNNDAIMACLRNITTEVMADVILNHSLYYFYAVPNLDNDFVPIHPQSMVNRSTAAAASLDVFYNIDFMMGSCSIDGALFLPYYAYEFHIKDLERLEIPRTAYETEIIPRILRAIFTNVQNISKAAIEMTLFEYTNWTDPDDATGRNLELVAIETDANMFVPMVTMAQLHAAGSNRRNYVYEFSTAPTTHYIPVPSWLDGPTQANHADDFLFVFGFTDQMLKLLGTDKRPILYSDKDIQVSKTVMSMWTNFAKTGDPNTPYSVPAHWPQYTMTSQNYLDITPTITSSSVKERIAAKRMELWMDLLPSFLKPNH